MVEHIAPHIAALKDAFNFTIESQVLYHAPLSFEPAFGSLSKSQVPALPSDDSGNAMEMVGNALEIVRSALSVGEEGWTVGEEDMKIFVNSEKWSLGGWL